MHQAGLVRAFDLVEEHVQGRKESFAGPIGRTDQVGQRLDDLCQFVIVRSLRLDAGGIHVWAPQSDLQFVSPLVGRMPGGKIDMSRQNL